MLVQQILTTTTKHIKQVACARNIGIMAPMLKQASDPIQSLFVEKIKEYAKNSEGYVHSFKMELRCYYRKIRHTSIPLSNKA